ncbi:Ig-like domain-containing protein [Flavobacterium capsici]|uniref:Ig-like domain-containing protein n=1 Tax=Flavobacterium capsici TaxID=3075618 RepID=A0AA96EZD7_9FLAO|nr:MULTISPECIES: Ig-like domain-containing protein [unclassified Flavobacterium]WNM19558.1 Ig-like domain-containing protein [Flavobacterium sp. PMR2A8]WNM20947.1 Ig-like domain-containing protein [Flavobacterium sp. PMTSA4]
MAKQVFKLFFLMVVLAFASCAKRGTITGGDKDTLAPVLKTSFPKNGSVNFQGKEIKLVFDEYVKLKNINKQLIVSPPMKIVPEIFPQVASKTITIKIKDTLQPNTTYSFNFGQSIEDNNEGNPYSQFKYVFSTGSYIDSLKLSVKIKDALEKKVDNFVSVMLYEVDEKFNDSTIYKETPRYVANTLDSLKLVTIENIKAGKYQLIALKDNGNNKFNPKSDKIGFYANTITIPDDDIYELELFKEELPFKANKPVQASGNRLLIATEGKGKGTKVSVKNGTEVLPSMITQFPKKDSLQIWCKLPKVDSLLVSVEKDNFKKEFWTKIKAQKKDTLRFSSDFAGNLPLRERFGLTSTTPIVKVDKSKISIINKDSLAVDFTTEFDEFNQKIYIDFKKEPSEKYIVSAFPDAFVDFFDNVNDTLSYKLNTKNATDYGNLRLILENAKRFPIIVELTNKDGKVKATAYTEKETTVEFMNIEPLLYTVRIIYDDNKNGVWDTGSYLEKRQSEEVIYFPKEIDVRANWDVEQPINIGN